MTHGTARVHICARGGQGAGLTHSHLLDFVLMDGGDGDKRTQENLGRVIMGLAKRVAKNELEGPKVTSCLPHFPKSRPN